MRGLRDCGIAGLPDRGDGNCVGATLHVRRVPTTDADGGRRGPLPAARCPIQRSGHGAASAADWGGLGCGCAEIQGCGGGGSPAPSVLGQHDALSRHRVALVRRSCASDSTCLPFRLSLSSRAECRESVAFGFPSEPRSYRTIYPASSASRMRIAIGALFFLSFLFLFSFFSFFLSFLCHLAFRHATSMGTSMLPELPHGAYRCHHPPTISFSSCPPPISTQISTMQVEQPEFARNNAPSTQPNADLDPTSMCAPPDLRTSG